MGLDHPSTPSPYKTYEDDSTVVAARFPAEITKMLDHARENVSKSGPTLSRSAFLKTAIHWYLNYLGYKPARPNIGGRRTTKE